MSQAQSRVAAIVILVLLVAFMALFLGPTGKLLPIEQGALQLISPIQYALTRSMEALDSLGGIIKGPVQLQKENEALLRQIGALSTQVEMLREAQIENEVLRKQLGFAEANPSYQVLSAEVIGRDPSNLVRSLITDRGSKDGVVSDMPVITDRGLVGRVIEVHGTSSTVLLLTDAASSVNALVQRTRSTGIVQGRMGRNPVMRFIPQGTSVEVGDVILTSGLGGNFPKRIVIGYVASVTGEDIDLFQEAEIQPAVDYSALEMVLLLLSFSPLEPVNTNGVP